MKKSQIIEKHLSEAMVSIEQENFSNKEDVKNFIQNFYSGLLNKTQKAEGLKELFLEGFSDVVEYRLTETVPPKDQIVLLRIKSVGGISGSGQYMVGKIKSIGDAGALTFLSGTTYSGTPMEHHYPMYEYRNPNNCLAFWTPINFKLGDKNEELHQLLLKTPTKAARKTAKVEN